ncbi:2-dehydro-3-deoxygalactonokinase [Spirosoma flavus]
MVNFLLCCDWGTSFFRLRLMDVSDYQSLGEIHSQTGVAGTFTGWQNSGESQGISRDQFFRQQLKKQIDRLAEKVNMSLSGIPVVISGMASSSIGMDELPYATLPFAVDGSQASVRHFDAQANFPHEIMLISGVSSDQDVMRGEETQLVGLIALLQLSGDKPQDAICIFPGTHSKHMAIQGDQLVGFDTYMTGELFELMAHQSILKDSVDTSHLTHFTDSDKDAFRRGVRRSTTSPILNSLFTIRTNQLFDKLTKKQNALYLSGLLIGSELNPLLNQKNSSLVLCSGSNLSVFYELALAELNLLHRTITIPPDVIDRVASIGQINLFQNQTAKVPAK